MVNQRLPKVGDRLRFMVVLTNDNDDDGSPEDIERMVMGTVRSINGKGRAAELVISLLPPFEYDDHMVDTWYLYVTDDYAFVDQGEALPW